MSVATTNSFSVLGESTSTPSAVPSVGSGGVHLENGLPKTASSTSSKKADVNPKADPSKARKKPTGPPSNDRVLRESKNTAGRANNRRANVREGTPSHESRRHDRNDRTHGKRDTAKRSRSGWGDENQEPAEEVAGEEIAQEQRRADAAASDVEEETAPEPQLTLAEYQNVQRESAAGLNTRKAGGAVVKSADGAAALAKGHELVHEQLEAPQPRKAGASKPRKEVQTLNIDVSAVPPARSGDRESRGRETNRRDGRRNGDREGAPRGPRAPRSNAGGKPAAMGGKPAGKGKPDGQKKSRAAPKLDLGSLPKLN